MEEILSLQFKRIPTFLSSYSSKQDVKARKKISDDIMASHISSCCISNRKGRGRLLIPSRKQTKMYDQMENYNKICGH